MKYKIELLLAVFVLVLLVIVCVQCSNSKATQYEIKKYKQNEQAAKKEIKRATNKQNELFSQVAVYVGDETELKKNNELSGELNKYKDKVLYLTKIILSYEKNTPISSNNNKPQSSVLIDTVVKYQDTTVNIDCHIAVFSNNNELQLLCDINSYRIDTYAYIGILKDSQDILHTFVRSPLKDAELSLTSVMDTELFQKPVVPKYGLCLYGGGGLCTDLSMGVRLGLSLGVGFYYSLFNF